MVDPLLLSQDDISLCVLAYPLVVYLCSFFQSHPLFTIKIIALDIKSDHIFANGPQMKSDQGTLNCYLQTNPGMLKGLCEQLIIKGNPTSRVDWIITPDSFPLLLAGQNKVDIVVKYVYTAANADMQLV